MTYTTPPIVARPATGPGALDGFESSCTCGLVLRSSIRSILEADVAEHAAYHARQAPTLALEVERIYDELKFADRMTPGRTPWQTLRRRAETFALEGATAGAIAPLTGAPSVEARS